MEHRAGEDVERVSLRRSDEGGVHESGGVVIARKAVMAPPGVLRARNGRGDIFPFKFHRLLGACLTGHSLLQQTPVTFMAS